VRHYSKAAIAGRGEADGIKPPNPKGRLMPAEIFTQLALIGPYVYADVVLFTQITRCIRQHLIAANALEAALDPGDRQGGHSQQQLDRR